MNPKSTNSDNLLGQESQEVPTPAQVYYVPAPQKEGSSKPEKTLAENLNLLAILIQVILAAYSITTNGHIDQMTVILFIAVTFLSFSYHFVPHLRKDATFNFLAKAQFSFFFILVSMTTVHLFTTRDEEEHKIYVALLTYIFGPPLFVATTLLLALESRANEAGEAMVPSKSQSEPTLNYAGKNSNFYNMI